MGADMPYFAGLVTNMDNNLHICDILYMQMLHLLFHNKKACTNYGISQVQNTDHLTKSSYNS